MPRPASEEEEKRLIWGRILEAALKHHRRTKVYGMQKVIAADSGAGTAAVSKWAKAKSKPGRETMRDLADLYGVSLVWLQGRDDSSQADADFGPPDALLRQAADITELVVSELLPDGTASQFIAVMRRAHELLLSGRDEDAARGQLFLEVSREKRTRSEQGNGASGA